jgi:hypothetical protein
LTGIWLFFKFFFLKNLEIKKKGIKKDKMSSIEIKNSKESNKGILFKKGKI